MALTADTTQTKQEKGTPAVLMPYKKRLKVAASAKIFYGAMVVTDAGFAKPATSTAAALMRAVGRAVGSPENTGQTTPTTTVDNSSGADGDLEVAVEAGIFSLTNDGGVGALADGDYGLPCYLKDDETVSKDSSNGNRAVAGIFLGLDPETSRPWVAIGLGDEQRPRILSVLAAADLTAKQFFVVKLDNTGKAALGAAVTDALRGILTNKPNVGEVARICVHGPCPYHSGAATTAGGDGTTDANGKATDAAATNRTWGYYLEAAGAGDQTKMGFVQPGKI